MPGERSSHNSQVVTATGAVAKKLKKSAIQQTNKGPMKRNFNSNRLPDRDDAHSRVSPPEQPKYVQSLVHTNDRTKTSKKKKMTRVVRHVNPSSFNSFEPSPTHPSTSTTQSPNLKKRKKKGIQISGSLTSNIVAVSDDEVVNEQRRTSSLELVYPELIGCNNIFKILGYEMGRVRMEEQAVVNLADMSVPH